MRPPKKHKQSQLSDDDVEIWHRIARTVNAYKPTPIISQPAVKSRSDSLRSMSPRAGAGNMGISNKKAPVLERHSSKIKATSIKPPPQIAADKRVRRGKVVIDRKVDLHDMTQDQAYNALFQTLHGAANRGQSCILVVTGKGAMSQSPYGGGVLRRMLPLWLGSRDIRPLISRYAQAHIRHGGSGAWYVFIKNKG